MSDTAQSMPASETETRVAEDVKRLRSVAEFHTGTDLAPEDEAALTRVLDALETAQAEKQAAVNVANQRGQQIAGMAGEAHKKDETIARLRSELQKIADGCPDPGWADQARAALAEQGDEG